MVPESDGLWYKPLPEEDPWLRYSIKAPRPRHAIRESIQRSTDSVVTLSRRYGINPKTVRNWRSRESVEDARMATKTVRSTSLMPLEEAAAVAFRQKTLLPLADCLHALQREMPSPPRSSLRRLYQRHGISQRPQGWRTKTREKSSSSVTQ